MPAENLPLSGVGFGSRQSANRSRYSRGSSAAERVLVATGKALPAIFQVPWQQRVWQSLARNFCGGPYLLFVHELPDLVSASLRRMRSARQPKRLG